MGLWIVQCIKRELNDQYSFKELAEMADKVAPFRVFIDINDKRFENPANMIKELQDYVAETGQAKLETPGELTRAVYENLALYYANEIHKLSTIIADPIDTLNIVGGGSNVTLMNQLTADLANVKVVAGPSEATAIGNLLVQMITTGAVKDVVAGRKLIKASNMAPLIILSISTRPMANCLPIWKCQMLLSTTKLPILTFARSGGRIWSRL